MSKTNSTGGAREAATLLFLYTETPLHVGSGSDVGAIDLPIMRERMTGLPTVPGSGLKGCLREVVTTRLGEEGKIKVNALFGPPPPSGKDTDEDQPSDYAGAASFTDARLLLFPVRSAYGGWAWLTCPLVLDRLRRDLAATEVKVMPEVVFTTGSEDNKAMVDLNCVVTQGGWALLEDSPLQAETNNSVGGLARWLADRLPLGTGYDAYRKRLAGQLLVVSDTTFTRMARYHTEVATRVRIDSETHTVANGALWTEESLPAESLLWSVAHFTPGRQAQGYKRKDGSSEGGGAADKAAPKEAALGFETAQASLKTFKEVMGRDQDPDRVQRLRLGGDQSIGRGVVGLKIEGGNDATKN